VARSNALDQPGSAMEGSSMKKKQGQKHKAVCESTEISFNMQP